MYHRLYARSRRIDESRINVIPFFASLSADDRAALAAAAGEYVVESGRR